MHSFSKEEGRLLMVFCSLHYLHETEAVPTAWRIENGIISTSHHCNLHLTLYTWTSYLKLI